MNDYSDIKYKVDQLIYSHQKLVECVLLLAKDIKSMHEAIELMNDCQKLQGQQFDILVKKIILKKADKE